jgi:hypothetical protein
MFDRLPRLPPSLEPRSGFTLFEGGYDRETPTWLVPAGRVRDALNYEIAVQGGYQDVTGYERFDGRPAPSEAEFTILDVTVTGSIVVGDTVTGATSGATGVVIAVAAYPDDPTQSYLVLTKVTGTFDEDAENLEVSAVVEGNTDADGYENSAPTAELTAQYFNLAADSYRADIGAVTGEDSVWGVFILGDEKFAIRNAVGGATAVLFKATTGGWAAVTMTREVAFTSGGVAELTEGETITGATSAATAVVRRIQVTSGTWAAGTAAGWLTISGQTGTFQAENLNASSGGANIATIAGNSAANSLAPDGQLDSYVSNFANPRGSSRIYCADGVNPGWEFDGTYFVKIRTGMTNDTPDHVHVHKNQLVFSFDGSVQHSGVGDPMTWSVVTGAAEIAIGERVTGFQIQPGGEGNAALLICGQKRNHVLYGNDSSDWNLVPYRDEIGAYEWTIQTLAFTLFLHDLGITNLQTAEAFGNFAHTAMSTLIQRIINAKRGMATASTVVRDKSQYRLFFSDDTAIYVTMRGTKLLGMMPVQLNDTVVCTCSQQLSDDTEEIFFGSDDGYVYQMERGTSFDGDSIYAYLYTHFDHVRALEYMKDFFAPVTVEARGTGYAEFDLSYQLDYARTAVFQPGDQTADIPTTEGSAWDSGLSWDTFVVWDNASVVPTTGLDLRGEGRNISWIIRKDSDYFEPLLLSGVHFRYVNRGPLRG